MYAETIARENATGKMYVRGFDRYGRPIIYAKLCRRDSCVHEDSVRHVVYCLERAIACLDQREAMASVQSFNYDVPDSGMHDTDGKIVVLVDFTGYSRHNRPALKTVREAITILQDHYPERLGEAYLLNPPMKVAAVWKLLRRIVDPQTYQKVILVKDNGQHEKLIDSVFNRAMLERCAGGENDAEFDSHVFLTKQVNGELYGAEFDAQLAASTGVRPRVSFSDEVDVKPAEKIESDGGWTFSLQSLFGGEDSSLW